MYYNLQGKQYKLWNILKHCHIIQLSSARSKFMEMQEENPVVFSIWTLYHFPKWPTVNVFTFTASQWQ